MVYNLLKTHCWTALLVLALFIGIVGIIQTPVASADDTAVITWRIFMDDNADMVYNLSTDSNGIENSGEWIRPGLWVVIVDANGVQVKATNVFGNGSATVSTAAPVSITLQTVDINIPSMYEPSTQTYHLLQDITPGSTTAIPIFGYGPSAD